MTKWAGCCLTGVLLLAACSEKQPEAATSASTASMPTNPVAPAGSVATNQATSQAISPAGNADRLPPPEVPPVERDGVRYAQAEDGRTVGYKQVSGVLVASAADSGKQLWTLAVYANKVDPKQEADVQWVYFKLMAFEPDGRLRIVNEADQAFFVDVRRQTVSPAR